MKTPRWNDPAFRGGTMLRSALWLLQEIGEGNTFTKEEHRACFPGISQADRRMRDLRNFGWVIDTSDNDVRLSSDQQRLVRVGQRVWEPSERRNGGSPPISTKQRLQTFAQDSYQCTVCGIAGGQDYLEYPGESATLVASRREFEAPDGSVVSRFITECKRCRAGGGTPSPSESSVVERASKLSHSDRADLLQWLLLLGRETSELNRLAKVIVRFPSDAQTRIKEAVGR